MAPMDRKARRALDTVGEEPGRLRFDRQEAAGALGDLGTYIPLFVGMVSVNGLAAGPVLFFSGLFNVVTGLVFGIPMAVQPMKAIATVALAERLTVEQLLAAGLVTGAAVFVLGLTGLITWLNSVIPKSVVRGLQLGLGLKLVVLGVRMVKDTSAFWGADSIFVGVVGVLIVLALFFSRRIPGALVLLAGGIVLLFVSDPGIASRLTFTPDLPRLVPFTADDFLEGAWKGAIPQLPLTTLNSVIAVCALASDLFPGTRATPRRVAVSVGLMNLLSCWFGAMPMCHGAGGLAGQVRFGARTGGSVVMLGVAKMMLGLAFGSATVVLFAAFPRSVLGVLLLFSGMELALVSRDMRSKTDVFVMLLTTAAILALDSTAIGFAIGMALAYLFLHGLFRIERHDEA